MGLVHYPPHSKSAAAWMPAADLERTPAGTSVQSLPETVQVLRPPGPWAVPGAFSPLAVAVWRCDYDGGMVDRAPQPDAERIIRWIMLGIVIWGLFHAVGAWRLNHDPRRMLVVLGCVAAFLGFWLVMLASWRRRHARP